LSKRPSFTTIAASGMNKIDGGTRVGEKKSRRPPASSLGNAAARSHRPQAPRLRARIPVDTTETITVFHSHAGYSVLNSSFSKCANVGPMIQNGLPSRESSSLSGLNDVIAIQ